MRIKSYEQIYGLYGRGYKQKEIARMLNIDPATVSRVLAELKEHYPWLFPTNHNRPRTIQYDSLMDAHTKERF